LPFGPVGIRGTRGEPEVQTGKGRVGFAFFAKRIPERGLAVEWHVDIDVDRVDSRGRVVRRVAGKAEFVGRVHDDRELDFTTRARFSRGLYRYLLVLRDRSGRRLARYGQYMRIMRPRFQVEAEAFPERIRAGDTIGVQIANLGTVIVNFGAGGIQRRENGTWVPAGFFSRGGVRRRLASLMPGRRGPCRQLTIPADAPVGVYRAKSLVYTQAAHRPRSITARFTVEP
jgi:hypothetical protein